MEEIQTIDCFEGKHAFLSNFFSHEISIFGKSYPSIEHAYQAAKATTEEDSELIHYAPTAAAARKCGRRIKVRDDWKSIKLSIMYALLRIKFSDPVLRDKLLDTDCAILIKGNWWGDIYWGVHKGVGENWLGRLLMMLRANLRKESSHAI